METETELIFDGDLGNVFTTDGSDGTQVNEVDAVTDQNVGEIQMEMSQMSAEDQAAMIAGLQEAANNVEVQNIMINLPVENQEEIPFEEQLKSTERLDRSSPDLWPQNLSSAAQYVMAKYQSKTGETESNIGIWAQGLDPEDINLLHQFGSLTSASLVEEVKKLQNIAYQLGLEETKEMTRGKLLHILDDDI